MTNMSEFIEVMETYSDSPLEPEEAIELAIENSEVIGEMKWMGEFKEGVFYADSERSLWFADMTTYEAKLALADSLF